ncbi:50S ribosomal protein L1 [Candidatus Falkowbacteria bacterium]|nr:50S ribosomal protein L1 [Candidatus Falkowbacteria bacterium]
MPNKQTKKLQQTTEKDKTYPIAEAIEIAKQNAKAKFDETLEAHFRLGIDPKKGEQQIRGVLVLPHSFGKSKKIAAFIPADRKKEAQDAGADIVYSEQDVDELKKTGKIDFDIAIATPDMMKTISPLAKILGPKGLMPTPKNETITTNLKKTIEELKKGKIAYKNDDTANLHQAFGKASMDSAKLVANFTALFEAIKKSKPESSKGIFLKKVVICSTMGKAIKVQI